MESTAAFAADKHGTMDEENSLLPMHVSLNCVVHTGGYTVIHCSLHLFFIYALLCIAYDLRSHSVPLMVHLLFVLPGLIVFGHQVHAVIKAYAWTRTVHQIPGTASSALSLRPLVRTALLPLLPGLLALMLSKLSRKALGLGDALFLLITGLYIPITSMLLLLLSGILVGFLVSAVLLIYGHIHGRSMRNVRFPWIPCTLPALCAIAFAQFPLV